MTTQLYFSGVNAMTTDGVLNLNGANIELLPGWRPRVAKRRRGLLGGQLYEDVVESIPLRVYGASPADCVQFLELMVAAMDQARTWKDGAAVGAVNLNYAINGTALSNPLRAAVLGTPADAADILSLPVTFNQNLQVFEVNPVTLPLERRGQWLGDEETVSRATSTSYSPGVITPSSNFTDTLVLPSPYKLTINYDDLAGSPADTNIMLLTARSSGRLLLIEGEDETGGEPNFASATDSDASGGDVGRYTPNDTDDNRLFWSTSLDSDVRAVFVIFHLKNRSSTISYDLKAKARGRFSPVQQIGTDDNDPQLIAFGPLISPYGAITQIELSITASGTGSASESLDIDTIGVVAVEGTSNVLAAFEVGNATSDPVINHELLTLPRPTVTSNESSGLSYRGIAYLWNTGNTAAALVMGGSGTSWLLRNDVSDQLEVGASWVRRPAYLVPR